MKRGEDLYCYNNVMKKLDLFSSYFLGQADGLVSVSQEMA